MKPFFINPNKDFHAENNRFFTVGEKDEITNLVAEFYSKNPFPNYQDFENIVDLTDKLEENDFLRNFKKNIGLGKKIIEVGSGTCQLSLALSHGTNNFVVALDPTKKSLDLGYEFSVNNNINNCVFIHADIFSNPIKPGTFDFVWCSGVLHHTKSPELGFKIISEWVKPGGIILVGLYNRYGRFRTFFRKFIYKLSGESFGRKLLILLDPYLRTNLSIAKRNAWISDKYEHPVESTHTLDEVIEWFNDTDIKFLSSIPSCDFSDIDYENMFAVNSKGNYITRLLAQLGMINAASGKEGGLFIVVGRKN
jgi:SAM-dependent methyltransferase